MNLKCFACGGDVIWGGDHDTEGDEGLFHRLESTLQGLRCVLPYVSPNS